MAPVDRADGPVKNLLDKTAAVTGAIRSGDPEIDEVMTGLEVALAEVPADIAQALAPPSETETQAEA